MTFRRMIAGLALGALAMSTASCSNNTAHASPPSIHVVSGAIQPGATIPSTYTCDGANISPALKWSTPPAPTKSVAIICDDPDAPSGDFTHWIVYNIPPTVHRLPEHVPQSTTLSSGARQGQNDFEHIGYGGPCPPPGPAHHYHFHVYALDTRLGLPDNAQRSDVDNAIQGHILSQGELVATYGRSS